MIVLDEQLLSYGIRQHVLQWYRGTVTDITPLRPGTVMRDEAIPLLLRAARRPTFVTINVADFWQRLSSRGSMLSRLCGGASYACAGSVGSCAPSLYAGPMPDPEPTPGQSGTDQSTTGSILYDGRSHDPTS